LFYSIIASKFLIALFQQVLKPPTPTHTHPHTHTHT